MVGGIWLLYQEHSFCRVVGNSMARTKAFDTEEVLERALRIFWQKGYEGTSMQDLVDGMQINRASIYDTFGNKEQLYLTALQRYLQHQHHQVQQLLLHTSSVQEALSQLLENMIQESLHDAERKGCFVVNATTGLANRYEEVNQLVLENERRMAFIFKDFIQQGKEQGEIRSDQDEEALSSYIFSSIQGLRVLAVTNSDMTTLHRVKDLILSTIFD